jgi:hypothetical protein
VELLEQKQRIIYKVQQLNIINDDLRVLTNILVNIAIYFLIKEGLKMKNQYNDNEVQVEKEAYQIPFTGENVRGLLSSLFFGFILSLGEA